MPFQSYPRIHRGEPALPGTRALRLFAGIVCVMAAIEAVAVRQPLVVLVGLLLGLGFALTAHLFVERNRSVGTVGLPAGGTWQGGAARWLLLAIGLAGLLAALLDLGDLTEEDELLSYPIAQMGLPVMAFVAALAVGMAAMKLHRRVPEMQSLQERSLQERSLWRAYLALVACGVAALGLAELAEHGLPDTDMLYLLIASALSLILMATLWRQNAVAAPPQTSPAGPQTLGIRVDGRARWVDFLEDCMSFGQRRHIVAATLTAARIAPGQNLLDIGCGTGELVVAAARIIADGGRVLDGYALGVDATPGMIDLARQRAAQEGIVARFEVAVAESLPLPDAVIDGVTSSFFLHHLPSAVKAEALREMWRVLRPGGRLVVTDYGRPQNLLGLLASFPMRFNFHEYVRGQLAGEIEALIAAAEIGRPAVVRSFLGYINVLVLEKPRG